MRIGIFTETFLPQINGVVTSVCNTSKLLSRKHEISVFTVGNRLRERFYERFNGYDVYRFRSIVFAPYPEYRMFVPSPGIWKLMIKKNLDVIHARSTVSLGLVAKKLARRFGRPIIGTFDTPISDYVFYLPLIGRLNPARQFMSDLARKYTIWFYNHCDLVTAPSAITKKQLIAMGVKKPIEVLSNGVDVSLYSPEKRNENFRCRLCPDGEPLIIHVGRITREKNVLILLKAAKILAEEGEKFRLMVAGRGPALDELKVYSRENGLEDVVLFAGFVPDQELPKYYASSDFFVTASPVETQGIVILEAMASGLPVIGADAGAIPELVKRENGFLFNAENPKMLAEKIRILLRDSHLRKKMGRNSISMVMKHSIKNVAEKLERLYQDMI